MTNNEQRRKGFFNSVYPIRKTTILSERNIKLWLDIEFRYSIYRLINGLIFASAVEIYFQYY